MAERADVGSVDGRPCKRCKERPAVQEIRTDAVCGPCYCSFIQVKAAKRLEVLTRESRASGATKRGKADYTVGLSFGPSSAAMVQLLDVFEGRRAEKNQRPPTTKYTPITTKIHVVHVDTDLPAAGAALPPSDLLQRWAERYPRFVFRSVPLTAAIGLSSIDWAALPTLKEGCPPEEQLRHLFDNLPSATSAADLTRLFVRHVLMAEAVREACCALLLGNSTTSLAALTLSETAKGRAFSLPWLINDGAHSITDYSVGPERAEETGSHKMLVYFLVRELYRNELTTYTELAGMDTSLIIEDTSAANPIISHKHQTIDDVMTRYFREVEENFPSVVANVVRTTAKLSRDEPSERCGLCGVAIDATGNERWAGEMGDTTDGESEAQGSSKLCHGCQRSVNG
ncbi:Cytoplasmic tRNA 2-thiolation protein 2 [Pyricularia oryzae]